MDDGFFNGKRLLVIVESPTKTRLIKQILTACLPDALTIHVEASCGHICDLAKKNLSINLENNFLPHYQVDPNKRFIIDKLNKLRKVSDLIILATDNDREGEAIAWHLKEVLKVPLSKYYRIVFNEITKAAITKALCSIGKIDINLVNAQQTRRIMDRIIGYKVSPLLCDGSQLHLSAGRVQSSALNLIITRQDVIEKHMPVKSWKLYATLDLVGEHGSRIIAVMDKALDDEQEARDTLDVLSTSPLLVVNDCTLSETANDFPPPAFTTASLQQEAYKKLKTNVKTTMQNAQKLYEMGAITYIRTESTEISKEAIGAIRSCVESRYGTSELCDMGSHQMTQTIDDAKVHEPIRPTDMEYDVDSLPDDLKSLYGLIVKRTLATQMKPAIKKHLEMTFSNQEFHFKVNLSGIVNPGYLMLYDKTCQDLIYMSDLKKCTGNIRVFEAVVKNECTRKPLQYNEADMINILQGTGIGRPSTYSSTLEKLYDRQYVCLEDVEGEPQNLVDYEWKCDSPDIVKVKREISGIISKERLMPTKNGKKVHAYLAENFGDLINPKFTADMEHDLDRISKGEIERLDVLNNFWNNLAPRIMLAEINKHSQTKQTILETVSFEIKNKLYSACVGQFGPVLFQNNETSGSVAKHIDLRSYLQMTKKTYMELSKNDVELLVAIPLAVSTNIQLNYGRYGFYVTCQDYKENFTISESFMKLHFDSWDKLIGLNVKHVAELIKMKKMYLFKKTGQEKPMLKKTKNKQKYQTRSFTRIESVLKSL